MEKIKTKRGIIMYCQKPEKKAIQLKIKKALMTILFSISLMGIGACFYKMYDAIDTQKYAREAQIERTSAEQSIAKEVEEKQKNEVMEKVTATVVGISKLKNNGTSIFLQDGVSKLGLGTGVILSENGYILTNQHVCGSKYSNCYVTLENGDFYNGNVVWSDSDLDLAIVKIQALGLDPITIGDSDHIKIADPVYAIGNPIGLEFQRTVTAGIISGKNRTIKIDEEDKSSYMEDLIQTDATINPGNSGGPLINEKGEMIGINSVKITSAEGIGFAIPINIMKPVIEKMIQDNKFEEASIGIFAYDKGVIPYLDANIKLEKGIYVAQVEEKGAAMQAGLKVGDVITQIDTLQVNTMSDLRTYIYTKKPDDEVKLTILRNGKEQNVNLKLGKKETA